MKGPLLRHLRGIFFLFLLVPAAGVAQPLTVMTYNIRYDNPGDGINQWSSRKQRVFALIRKYSPDIIGVQEALHHQLNDITESAVVYQRVGVARDDGKQKGEYSALLIRKDRFAILEQNTFWLSETPGVPGSKSWDAAITRVATWAKLKDNRSGLEFLVINTHFDHIGKQARKHSARILRESAEKLAKGLPVLITGDFNFTRDEEPYHELIKPGGLALSDTAPEKNPPGTFCNFGVNSMPCRPIDYIFHTPHWQSSDYRVITDNDGANYPSDHLPLMVTVAIKE